MPLSSRSIDDNEIANRKALQSFAEVIPGSTGSREACVDMAIVFDPGGTLTCSESVHERAARIHASFRLGRKGCWSPSVLWPFLRRLSAGIGTASTSWTKAWINEP